MTKIDDSRTFLRDLSESDQGIFKINRPAIKPDEIANIDPNDIIEKLRNNLDKLICFVIEQLPENEKALIEELDNLLSKVESDDALTSEDVRQILDACDKIEKSAQDPRKTEALREKLKTAADKMRLEAANIIVVQSDAQLNKIEEQMDNVDNLKEDSDVDNEGLHNEKIKLQDILKETMNDVIETEKIAVDALKSIKDPKINNLAEKKKKLDKIKTDLDNLLNSKSP